MINEIKKFLEPHFDFANKDENCALYKTLHLAEKLGYPTYIFVSTVKIKGQLHYYACAMYTSNDLKSRNTQDLTWVEFSKSRDPKKFETLAELLTEHYEFYTYFDRGSRDAMLYYSDLYQQLTDYYVIPDDLTTAIQHNRNMEVKMLKSHSENEYRNNLNNLSNTLETLYRIVMRDSDRCPWWVSELKESGIKYDPQWDDRR